MIIHEMKKHLYTLIFLSFFSVSSSAQTLQPAPTFNLLNAGQGAAALGMGGAFVAVANDLSAIYWNPAGLAQLQGFQIHVDYRYQGSSYEDFSEEVAPNRWDSKQRFSVSGNQLQSAAFSYPMTGKKLTFVPAFAFQRNSVLGTDRELKEPAGMVAFSDRDVYVQSQGTFREQFKGGEDEYSFGVGAKISKRFLIGGSWSFLKSGAETHLTGKFHDSFILPRQHRRTDIDPDQTTKDDVSGNYLKLGMLYLPNPVIRLGAYLRFPYTRKSDITIDRKGPYVRSDTHLDENGNIISVDTISGNLQEKATAQSGVEIPAEWGAGISYSVSKYFLLSGSVAYSNWSDAVLIVTNSSNTTLLPEANLPYPTLRAGSGPQHSLLQWRGGAEYLYWERQSGLALRAGIFRDGQPYGNSGTGRVNFNGYTFGIGYVSSGFRLDAALIKEKGEITFTEQSGSPSAFKNRRWLFGITFISQ